MSITLYGISNCDTVRKARRWLSEHDVEYVFHDLRKDGLSVKTLQHWNKKVGWEILLNKRGTTWRKLPETVRDKISQQSALELMPLELMLEQPTLIKRPVLETGSQVHVGFNTEHYTSLFG